MKRFIGDIAIEDPELALDVVQALENDPESGRKYEVEFYDNRSVCDPMASRGEGRNGCRLKIFVVEN